MVLLTGLFGKKGDLNDGKIQNLIKFWSLKFFLSKKFIVTITALDVGHGKNFGGATAATVSIWISMVLTLVLIVLFYKRD